MPSLGWSAEPLAGCEVCDFATKPGFQRAPIERDWPGSKVSPEYHSRYRPPDGNGDLPGEEDIGKIMTLAEKVMHRFFGFVKELKRDLETDQL